MRNFRSHLAECMDGEQGLPSIEAEPDALDLSSQMERDAVNFTLSDITDEHTQDPAIAYERVRQILADEGFLIPPVSAQLSLFDDTDGEDFIPLTHGPDMYYLYFAFSATDHNDYEIHAELLTEPELEEVLGEAEHD